MPRGRTKRKASQGVQHAVDQLAPKSSKRSNLDQLSASDSTPVQLSTSDSTPSNQVQLSTSVSTPSNSEHLSTSVSTSANPSVSDSMAASTTSSMYIDQITECITSSVLATINQKIDEAVTAALQRALPPTLATMSSTSTSLPLQTGASDVATTINSVSSAISGTSTLLLNQSSFHSASIQITNQINIKTKQKVWAGEYVELSAFLSSPSDTNSYQLHFDPEESSSTLKVVQQNKQQPITNIGLWSKAWNRFSAVVLEKNPNLAVGLAHHMEVVTDLAKKRSHWRYYDEEFRKLVARNEATWGTTHLELYLKAVVEGLTESKSDQSNKPARQQSQKILVPKGACVAFHVHGSCANGWSCSYQHKCFYCLNSHPASRCSNPQKQNVKILPKFQPQLQKTPFRFGASADGKLQKTNKN